MYRLPVLLISVRFLSMLSSDLRRWLAGLGRWARVGWMVRAFGAVRVGIRAVTNVVRRPCRACPRLEFRCGNCGGLILRHWADV